MKKLLILAILSLLPTFCIAEDIQEFVVTPKGNTMEYEVKEITAKAGSKIKIIMNNTATAPGMEHNVVVLKSADKIQEVGMAAMQAAPTYIPQNDAIIAATPIAKPGQKTEIILTVPAAGDYPYICTFPGHWAMMKGVLHSN